MSEIGCDIGGIPIKRRFLEIAVYDRINPT